MTVKRTVMRTEEEQEGVVTSKASQYAVRRADSQHGYSWEGSVFYAT